MGTMNDLEMTCPSFDSLRDLVSGKPVDFSNKEAALDFVGQVLRHSASCEICRAIAGSLVDQLNLRYDMRGQAAFSAPRSLVSDELEAARPAVESRTPPSPARDLGEEEFVLNIMR